MSKHSYFHCKHPGLTTEGITLTHHDQYNGPSYWKAQCRIGTLFGSEVDGILEAIGPTQDVAIARLEEEKRNLYESLWE